MQNYETIEQPSNLKIALYPHQLVSVCNMEKIELEKKIVTDNFILQTDFAINADMTGYGKTLSMITLILRNKMSWNLKAPCVKHEVSSHSGHHMTKYYKHFYEKINTTLILVGPSVCNQWLQEFKHTPLKVLAVTSNKICDIFEPEEYDVVIVTLALYNRLTLRFHKKAWKRFIFDEPGQLKVPAMKDIIAGFIWFVTATPSTLRTIHRSCKTSFMYRFVDRWGDFEYNMKFITIKNDEDFIAQSFAMPPTYHEYYVCYSPIYNAIEGLVGNKITEMIDAGNIIGVIEALGGKKSDNILQLIKQNKEIELEEIESKIKIWSLRCNNKKREEWKKRKELVLSQLKNLEIRFATILKSDCAICRDVLEKPIMEPGCQNIFCGKCILTWLKNNENCPLCRRSIPKTELIYINENYSEEEKMERTERLKTKEETILEIINNKKNSKFIVFSNWNESFESIRNLFRENNITFLEIEGSIDNRTKNINKYKNGEVNVIFLNSRFNGSGINLQETTDIILYHTMDSDTYKQIIGRANRIGRTKPLQVHHLLYKD